MIAKKYISIIVIILGWVLFVGCGTRTDEIILEQEVQETADVGISNFCKAILHRDDESINKAMLSRDELERNMLFSFVVLFQESSGELFTDDQANRIGMKYLDLLKKVHVETKILSSNNHTARVEVTVDQFDFKDIDEKEMQAELKKRSFYVNNETEMMEEFTKIFINHLSYLTPKGKASFIVDCTYDEGRKLWQPDDRNAVELAIGTSVLKLQ